MEVCDRVSGDSNGSQSAVQALIKRLAHRNANVQLYTLEVSIALPIIPLTNPIQVAVFDKESFLR